MHGDTLWNTAVIIGNKGNVIGKHRKACCLVLMHGSLWIHETQA